MALTHAQSESHRSSPLEQLADLERIWLALLVLSPDEVQTSAEQWGPMAQHLIDRGHGPALLMVLEGVLRQASIRSQRQVLLAQCADVLQWSSSHPLAQRQWMLLRRWLA